MINGDLIKSNKYSTEEIDTGKTWIDGRHIYRKVIATTSPANNNTWTDYNNNISNLDFYLTCYAFFKVEALFYISNYYEGNSGFFLAVPKVDTISINIVPTNWANRPMYIVMEYIKKS